GRPRRSGAARLFAWARRGEDRAGLGRSDRRLGRPSPVLRNRAGDADLLRRRLLGERGRAELARWADPRPFGTRDRGRADEPAARQPPRPAVAAGASEGTRRRAREGRRAARRGGGRGGAPSRAAAPRRRRLASRAWPT